MSLRRPVGVRAHLVMAMTAVAVAAVLIATIQSVLAVDRSVERFGRLDLELSADHTAGLAADFYAMAGRWRAQDVAELTRLENLQGHTLVVRDPAGRVLPGSSPRQAPERASAPVEVAGRKVGDISLAHLAGGYLRLRDTAEGGGLRAELHSALRSSYLVAGLTAAALGVLIAVALAMALARPIRRLTQTATRIEAGDFDATADMGRGAAEFGRLGHVLERLASTLKREDEIRKETISDLAHELRTPMAGLRARIEAAQDGVLTDLPAVLEAMHADVLRLAHLMEDVERLAEAQQPGMLLDRQEVDLAQLARARGHAFEDYFRAAGIVLLTDLEPVTTMGDAERLGQVVDNLLSNALRYTDEGGRVILRVVDARAEAMIEVADTGIGIAAEDLPRVFDRFWRSERSRSRSTGGSGLGLALVHELVCAHDGRVDIESRPGAGSRFRVHLPARPADAETMLEITEPPWARTGDGAPACVARAARELVASDWRAVERTLVRRIRAGLTLLIFELDGSAVPPAQAVTALMAVQAQLKGRGGRLVVMCPDGSAARGRLQAIGADRALTVVGTRDHAIEALADPSPAGALLAPR